MTLYLGGDDVVALATDAVVMEAARAAVQVEATGEVVVPPRLDLDHRHGFLRVMPAVVDSIMGVKLMTLVEGQGTRYLILLYDSPSGELVGVLDADEVTRLRTAATTVVAGDLLHAQPPVRLGLIGSGFEAEGHLRLMAGVWPLEQVAVYSRNEERRAGFAARMSDALGIRVEAVDCVADAAGFAPTTVLATKSNEPIACGEHFQSGGVVLSIGSTRPRLRELDAATFERAGTLVVDDPTQVASESGDVIEALACGALPRDRVVSMGTAANDGACLQRAGARDLLVFKSVGTAVQDLVLAHTLVEQARALGRGRELGELMSLKRFAGAGAQPLAGGGASG